MSKRRLGNLLKRKLALRKFFSLKGLAKDEWAQKQLREISRFGGDLIVMRMG